MKKSLSQLNIFKFSEIPLEEIIGKEEKPKRSDSVLTLDNKELLYDLKGFKLMKKYIFYF